MWCMQLTAQTAFVVGARSAGVGSAAGRREAAASAAQKREPLREGSLQIGVCQMHGDMLPRMWSCVHACMCEWLRCQIAIALAHRC